MPSKKNQFNFGWGDFLFGGGFWAPQPCIFFDYKLFRPHAGIFRDGGGRGSPEFFGPGGERNLGKKIFSPHKGISLKNSKIFDRKKKRGEKSGKERGWLLKPFREKTHIFFWGRGAAFSQKGFVVYKAHFLYISIKTFGHWALKFFQLKKIKGGWGGPVFGILV